LVAGLDQPEQTEQVATKRTTKPKIGRPTKAEPSKRKNRVVVLLDDQEHAAFMALAEELAVPPFLLGRWLITRHPLPGDAE
jgi:hypothetical protein